MCGAFPHCPKSSPFCSTLSLTTSCNGRNLVGVEGRRRRQLLVQCRRRGAVGPARVWRHRPVRSVCVSVSFPSRHAVSARVAGAVAAGSGCVAAGSGGVQARIHAQSGDGHFEPADAYGNTCRGGGCAPARGCRGCGAIASFDGSVCSCSCSSGSCVASASRSRRGRAAACPGGAASGAKRSVWAGPGRGCGAAVPRSCVCCVTCSCSSSSRCTRCTRCSRCSFCNSHPAAAARPPPVSCSPERRRWNRGSVWRRVQQAPHAFSWLQSRRRGWRVIFFCHWPVEHTRRAPSAWTGTCARCFPTSCQRPAARGPRP